MTTKSAFSALGAPMGLWAHERPVSRVWHCQIPSKVERSASKRPASGGCRFKLGKLRIKDNTAPEILNAVLSA
jgi:hypothetical protein